MDYLVPQLYFNSQHVGGNSDFEKLSESGLTELVKLVMENEPDEDTPKIPDEKFLLQTNDNDNGGVRCEVDSDIELARALKNSNLPKKRWKWLKSHNAAFSGKQLLEWLRAAENSAEKEGENSAINAANRLLSSNYIHSVQQEVIDFRADGTLYQLTEPELEKAIVFNFT